MQIIIVQGTLHLFWTIAFHVVGQQGIHAAAGMVVKKSTKIACMALKRNKNYPKDVSVHLLCFVDDKEPFEATGHEQVVCSELL